MGSSGAGVPAPPSRVQSVQRCAVGARTAADISTTSDDSPAAPAGVRFCGRFQGAWYPAPHMRLVVFVAAAAALVLVMTSSGSCALLAGTYACEGDANCPFQEQCVNGQCEPVPGEGE